MELLFWKFYAIDSIVLSSTEKKGKNKLVEEKKNT